MNHNHFKMLKEALLMADTAEGMTELHMIMLCSFCGYKYQEIKGEADNHGDTGQALAHHAGL